MSWYFQVLSKYAVFSGRAGREEYWMFVLFNMIFSIAAIILAYILGTVIEIEGVGYGFIHISYAFAVFIPHLAVTVRRLHDTEKSAWMLLIGLIPIIGLVWGLALMAKDSNPGTNQYGPEPGEISEDNILMPQYSINPFDRVFNILISITGWIAFGILILLFLIDFVRIFNLVDFVGLSYGWCYSCHRLMLFLFIVLGLSYTAKHDGHMIIDIGISRLPADTQKIFKGIMCLISSELIFLMALMLFVQSVGMMTGREIFLLPYFTKPWYPIMFLFSFGFVILCLVYIYKLVDNLKHSIKGTHFFFWLWATLLLIAMMLFLLNMKMSSEIIGAIGIAALLILFLIGMPVGIASILVGFLGLSNNYDFEASSFLLLRITSMSSGYLMPMIPFLILLTSILQRSGILQSLSFFLINCFSSFPGGKALGGFVAFFVGSPGVVSSQTSVEDIGNTALIHSEKGDKDNTQPNLTISSIAAGSFLSMLIPPSLALVIFGQIASQRIDKLFLGGLSAGFIVVQVFLLYFFFTGCFNPNAKIKPKAMPGKQIAAGIISIVSIAIIFFVFISGSYFYNIIYFSTIVALLTIILGVIHTIFIKRSVFKMLIQSLHQTLHTTGMIFLIIIGMFVFNSFLTMTKLPISLASFISSFDINSHLILLIILLVYLGLSCFIETLTLMVLSLPLLMPIVRNLGFDAVWFGVIITMISGIGMLLPPGGRNLKIIQQLKKTYQTKELVMGIAPVILLMFIIIGLLMVYPQIVTFLPNLLQ